MRFLTPALFVAVCSLHAAGEREALVQRAQADYDKVQAATAPNVSLTSECVQSQAALLAVAAPSETAPILYRKAYCQLAGAAVTHDPAAFTTAANDFDAAIAAWPDYARALAKNSPPAPAPSALKLLPWIAGVEARGAAAADARARNEASLALQSSSCTAAFMPAAFCSGVFEVAREWLGWVALQNEDLYAAAKYLPPSADSGWSHWARGEQAFRDHKYADAAAEYGKAVDMWTTASQAQRPSLLDRLRPQPQMAEARTQLGGAQLLAGDVSQAIETLNLAIKDGSSYAWAYYLRGKAEELAGFKDRALADYNMASRTAFAGAKDLASGEAHFYRGVLQYRRKDFDRAEDEFANALNLSIPERLKADAQAWRYLSAVEGGSCEASRSALERSLETASPYFPKPEARQVASSCLVRETQARAPEVTSVR